MFTLMIILIHVFVFLLGIIFGVILAEHEVVQNKCMGQKKNRQR